MLKLVMQVMRKFGVAVLLLVSWLAPAMACVAPDAQLSQEERACCRVMKSECGQMHMPISHGCCHKDVQAFHNNAIQSRSVDTHPVLVTMAHMVIADFWNLSPAFAGKDLEFSLPQSPPGSISVLRI